MSLNKDDVGYGLLKLNLKVTIQRTYSEPGTYFCTFTCTKWLPLIQVTNLYDNIYDWLKIVNTKHLVTGFVIMPNHIHVLIHIQEDGVIINKVLANGKRFLAYEIVKRLKEQNREDLLTILKESVKPEELSRNKKHRVFEPSSDIKHCYTEKFITQKLSYMHANPVSGKWSLAPSLIDYPHSSAAFYKLNIEHPKVLITHYKELGL